MFNRVRNALYNVVGGLEAYPALKDGESLDRPPLKFPYTRPKFLQLTTDDEVQVSADHVIRPIIVPRDITKLPWNSGYAEAINAGKSVRNEDQGSSTRRFLHTSTAISKRETPLLSTAPTIEVTSEQLSETIIQPCESIIQPSETIIQPSESIIQPSESIIQPSESIIQPSESIIQPSESIIQPSESIIQPSESIIQLSENTVENKIPSIDQTKEEKLISATTDSSSQSNMEDVFLGDSSLSSDSKLRAQPKSVEDITHKNNFITQTNTSEAFKKSLLEHTIPWIYFALFDGHAGSGVAVAASNTLHNIIQTKLQEVADLLIMPSAELNFCAKGTHERCAQPPGFVGFSTHRDVTPDSLIIGALESSFWEMDKLISLDKKHYTMTGGCTALVAVFIFGKLFVANAGDSRAVLCRGINPFPMSNDFTPETERDRIRKLGQLRPELLGGEFTHLEFARRPARKDIGEKLLYRDAYMSGWAHKLITVPDLKFPLIYGEGKRSRVLATIGVTRGFGDHDLKALNTDIDIKPFLTPEPEVLVFDLMKEELTDSDVLIMGTDGLWDVTTNEKAAEVVQKSLDHFPANDTQRYKYRYTSAAQDLVMHSRGKLRERNWRTADSKLATIDDISVFVIPLRPYKEEYIQWQESLN